MRDLPGPLHVMNAVAAVFTYTLMGLSDREMAEILNCTAIDIEATRAHPAYGEVFESIMGVFINTNSELLGSRIAAYSHDALTNVADLMASQDDGISLRASQDLLDRGGARPQDMSAKKAALGNELRIVVSKGGGDNGINVNINVNGDN